MKATTVDLTLYEFTKLLQQAVIAAGYPVASVITVSSYDQVRISVEYDSDVPAVSLQRELRHRAYPPEEEQV